MSKDSNKNATSAKKEEKRMKKSDPVKEKVYMPSKEKSHKKRAEAKQAEDTQLGNKDIEMADPITAQTIDVPAMNKQEEDALLGAGDDDLEPFATMSDIAKMSKRVRKLEAESRQAAKRQRMVMSTIKQSSANLARQIQKYGQEILERISQIEKTMAEDKASHASDRTDEFCGDSVSGASASNSTVHDVPMSTPKTTRNDVAHFNDRDFPPLKSIAVKNISCFDTSDNCSTNVSQVTNKQLASPQTQLQQVQQQFCSQQSGQGPQGSTSSTSVDSYDHLYYQQEQAVRILELQLQALQRQQQERRQIDERPGPSGTQQNHTIYQQYNNHKQSRVAEVPRQKKTPVCLFCGGDHFSDNCMVVPYVPKRIQIVVRKGVCPKCLYEHSTPKCKQTKVPHCVHCSAEDDHHSSLCTSAKHLRILAEMLERYNLNNN